MFIGYIYCCERDIISLSCDSLATRLLHSHILHHSVHYLCMLSYYITTKIYTVYETKYEQDTFFLFDDK